MKNGIYFELFAIKDGVRYNAKIIPVEEVSKIMANSVMDGLGKVIGFEQTDNLTERGIAKEMKGEGHEGSDAIDRGGSVLSDRTREKED